MSDPPQELLEATLAVLPGWVARSVERVLRAQRIETTAELREATAGAGVEARDAVRDELGSLLARDVDEQRTNPLAVLRAATRFPTRVLRAAGAVEVQRDDFQRERFPDDVYDLVPARWSDVDPALHEPGIVWGAWKAKTVLDRRQAEGKR